MQERKFSFCQGVYAGLYMLSISLILPMDGGDRTEAPVEVTALAISEPTRCLIHCATDALCCMHLKSAQFHSKKFQVAPLILQSCQDCIAINYKLLLF